MALPPPDYSTPSSPRPVHANAIASSSGSSSAGAAARSRPGSSSEPDAAARGDAFHWCYWRPNTPVEGKTKLGSSSVTINFPPGELICLVTPPNPDSASIGRDGRFSGVITVSSRTRKVFKAFTLQLVGTQRIRFSADGLSPPEDSEIFRRELKFDGAKENDGNVVLEPGVTTFEFSIRVPASAALSDRCQNGRIIYHTTATLVRLGSPTMFKPDISAKKESWVMCDPRDEESSFQYTNYHEGISDLLGPFALSLVSSELLVGAALGITLTLADPPKALTIFAIQVCIHQTIRLSRTPRDEVVEIKRPKRIVFSAGPKSGFGAREFMDRTKKSGEIVFEGSKKEMRNRDGGWVLKGMGRLPTDDDLRPTTLPGTRTSMRFRSDLTVEIVCNQSGPGVQDSSLKLITMLKDEDVLIAPCICEIDFISLPSYTPDDQPGAAPAADSGSRPVCRCAKHWDTLRNQELLAQKSVDSAVSSQDIAAAGGGTEAGKESEGRRGSGSGGKGQRQRKIGETYQVPEEP